MPGYQVTSAWLGPLAVGAGDIVQNAGLNDIWICAVDPPHADDAVLLVPRAALRIGAAGSIRCSTLAPRLGRVVIVPGFAPGGGGEPALAPVNVAAPAISGVFGVGGVLSLSQGSWTGSPTGYARRWLRGGTAISGATGPSYVPGAGDVGAVISAEVQASNAGGASPWVAATGGGVIADAPVEPTGSVIFGALNRAGEGAVPVAGVMDGVYGAFRVQDGMLAPASDSPAPGSYDVGGIAVTVEANARVLSNASEVQAVLNSTVVPAPGEQRKLRGGPGWPVYDMMAFNFANKQPPRANPGIWTSLDTAPGRRAVLTNWSVTGVGAASITNMSQGNVILRGLDFVYPQDPARNNYGFLTNTAVIEVARAIDVLIEDCDISAGYEPAITGYRPMEAVTAIRFRKWIVAAADIPTGADFNSGGGLVARNNNIHHVGPGIVNLGTPDSIIEGNEIHHIWGDFTSTQDGCARLLLRNNYCHSPIGDNDWLHQDFHQFQPIAASRHYSSTGVVIEGNILNDGQFKDLGRAGASGTGLSVAAVTLGAATTLTVASHAGRVLNWGTPAQAAVTLPARAAASGESFIFNTASADASRQLTISLPAGETQAGFPMVVTDASFALWNGPDGWVVRPRGYHATENIRRGDWTLRASDEGHVMWLEPGGGQATITLNSAAAITGVKLRMPDTGTARLVPAAGHTMELAYGGGPITELLITDLHQACRLTRAGTVWTVWPAICALQGFYSLQANNGSQTDWTIRHNIIVTTAPNGLQFEDGASNCEGLHVYNNAFLKSMQPAPNLDMIWSPNPAQSTWAYVRGPRSHASDNVVANEVFTVSGATETGNVELGIDYGDRGNPAKYAAVFNGGVGAGGFAVATRADVLEAYAPDDAGFAGPFRWWDYAAGAVKADAPAPAVQGAAVYDAGANTITVTADQLLRLRGAVVLRNGSDVVVAGTAAVDRFTLIFTPSAPLAAGSYQLVLAANAVEGQYNRHLPAAAHSFTVAGAPVAALRVASTGTSRIVQSGHSLTDDVFGAPWPGMIISLRNSLMPEDWDHAYMARSTIPGSSTGYRRDHHTSLIDVDAWADMASYETLVITERGLDVAGVAPPDLGGADYAVFQEDLTGELDWAVRLVDLGRGNDYLLYSIWPATDGSMGDFVTTTQDYERRFRHRADYLAWKLKQVRPSLPADWRVWIVPGHRLMLRLHADAASGAIPGGATFANFFSDNIHLSELGDYAIACLHMSVIYQLDLAAGTGVYVPPGVTTAQAQYIWAIARDIALNYGPAGLGGTEGNDAAWTFAEDGDHLPGYTPAPAPTVSFSDDFNRADGPLAGADWTLIFGASDPYTIAGNAMITTATSIESGIACPVLAGADSGCWVEADIQAIADNGGIALMRDAANYIILYARASDSRLAVRGRSGNVQFGPSIGGSAFVVAPGARLRLELSDGLNWRAFMNGVQSHTDTLSAAMTGVRGGFASRSAAGVSCDRFGHGVL